MIGVMQRWQEKLSGSMLVFCLNPLSCENWRLNIEFPYKDTGSRCQEEHNKKEEQE